MPVVAGLALVYPGVVADLIGSGLVAAALAMQAWRKHTQPAQAVAPKEELP
jgi:UPF0716 family protein affecting phage T7 exclusion